MLLFMLAGLIFGVLVSSSTPLAAVIFSCSAARFFAP
jgi:hypothetical protein